MAKLLEQYDFPFRHCETQWRMDWKSNTLLELFFWWLSSGTGLANWRKNPDVIILFTMTMVRSFLSIRTHFRNRCGRRIWYQLRWRLGYSNDSSSHRRVRTFLGHIANSICRRRFWPDDLAKKWGRHGLTVPLFYVARHQYVMLTWFRCAINCESSTRWLQALGTFELGRAIGRACGVLRRKNINCGRLCTGGMSHQLDGERAGFINRCIWHVIASTNWCRTWSLTNILIWIWLSKAALKAVELNMLIACAVLLLGKVDRAAS